MDFENFGGSWYMNCRKSSMFFLILVRDFAKNAVFSQNGHLVAVIDFFHEISVFLKILRKLLKNNVSRTKIADLVKKCVLKYAQN